MTCLFALTIGNRQKDFKPVSLRMVRIFHIRPPSILVIARIIVRTSSYILEINEVFLNFLYAMSTNTPIHLNISDMPSPSHRPIHWHASLNALRHSGGALSDLYEVVDAIRSMVSNSYFIMC